MMTEASDGNDASFFFDGKSFHIRDSFKRVLLSIKSEKNEL